MISSKSKFQTGFTLIELMVVVAIIGLLSSIVLASLNSARSKARDAKRFSDIKNISLAIELYYNDNNGVYPAGTNLLSCMNASGWPAAFSSALSPYMRLPLDPINGGNVADGATTYTCYTYTHNTVSGQEGYILSAYLANNSPSKTGQDSFGPYFSVYANCPNTATPFACN